MRSCTTNLWQGLGLKARSDWLFDGGNGSYLATYKLRLRLDTSCKWGSSYCQNSQHSHKYIFHVNFVFSAWKWESLIIFSGFTVFTQTAAITNWTSNFHFPTSGTCTIGFACNHMGIAAILSQQNMNTGMHNIFIESDSRAWRIMMLRLQLTATRELGGNKIDGDWTGTRLFHTNVEQVGWFCWLHGQGHRVLKGQTQANKLASG